MAIAHVNGVNLYYEITGKGFPLVFSHEFAGDSRSWAPQISFFSRCYQVIVYNNRGYPPSEIPPDPDAYSQDLLIEDLYQLFLHLHISKAHIVGLSMGGNVALNFGIQHPECCASLVIAGCGAGSTHREQFEQHIRTTVKKLETKGMKTVAEVYSVGPTRVQFKRKDPRGWETFKAQLAEHSAVGSALTFRGVQFNRPTIFTLEDKLKSLRVPTLVLIGDEDEPCIAPALFMKRHIPSAGLVVLPQSGHTINLEEPDLFNRMTLDFITAVEQGKWAKRDPIS